MGEITVSQLADQVRDFARDRDWETFHSPKNLAAAVSVEAGELLERFLWVSPEDSRALPPARLEQVGEEMAGSPFPGRDEDAWPGLRFQWLSQVPASWDSLILSAELLA